MQKRKKQTKQLSFYDTKGLKLRKDHGGSLATNKRRIRRPLNIKQSHHITMKSHHAIGLRSLFRHKKIILQIIKKNSLRFKIKVYEYAIQGNHIHLIVKAKSREDLQNFFRVIAGHTAQRILKGLPLQPSRGGAYEETLKTNKNCSEIQGCQKNQRKFWSYLLYSRIVSWGCEFKLVTNYIQKNTLELLGLIPYERLDKTIKSKEIVSRSSYLLISLIKN